MVLFNMVILLCIFAAISSKPLKAPSNKHIFALSSQNLAKEQVFFESKA